MDQVPAGLRWRKSARSLNTANCVEVARDGACGTVYIRDSKDPRGAVLSCDLESFTALVTEIKSGRLDRPGSGG
nr:DUF397 domain-containing protein [Actinoplanes nipponensis]